MILKKIKLNFNARNPWCQKWQDASLTFSRSPRTAGPLASTFQRCVTEGGHEAHSSSPSADPERRIWSCFREPRLFSGRVGVPRTRRWARLSLSCWNAAGQDVRAHAGGPRTHGADRRGQGTSPTLLDRKSFPATSTARAPSCKVSVRVTFNSR